MGGISFKMLGRGVWQRCEARGRGQSGGGWGRVGEYNFSGGGVEEEDKELGAGDLCE